MNSRSAKLLAPRWHTAGLVGILLATYAAGALWQSKAAAAAIPAPAPEHRGVLGIYATAIFLDAALFYYVWVFTSKNGTPLRELIGGRWASAKDFFTDVAIAAPFWVVWEWAAEFVHWILGRSTAKSIDPMLPRAPAEIGLWILVCLTAGFCEEVVFRGYLQKQLEILYGSDAVAIAGQAVCFGIAHGYQGWKNVVVIVVLGALYGVLSRWRGSTRPGMIAHAWADFYGGLQMHWLPSLFFR